MVVVDTENSEGMIGAGNWSWSKAGCGLRGRCGGERAKKNRPARGRKKSKL